MTKKTKQEQSKTTLDVLVEQRNCRLCNIPSCRKSSTIYWFQGKEYNSEYLANVQRAKVLAHIYGKFSVEPVGERFKINPPDDIDIEHNITANDRFNAGLVLKGLVRNAFALYPHENVLKWISEVD